MENADLYAGCGYGGSCFPKDVTALIKTAKDYDYTPVLLESVERVNNSQKYYLINNKRCNGQQFG